ncbi:MAG: nicotinamide mononucleotide transporter [Clostridia bacterium]|nr:nicotinamide mononucleotide transporter [Clostridia bacterium]
MKKLFSLLCPFEWGLWSVSLFAVVLSFALSPEKNLSSFVASAVGVTALIFVAKGHVAGQILTVVFAVFYGIISFTCRYYGEMITYLGMSAPAAIAATVSWLRHPYRGSAEVAVSRMTAKKWVLTVLATLAATVTFYFILGALDTAELAVSTLSVTTSFLASALTFLRSPLYACAYAANDVVLIALWILALPTNPAALPMVICFAAFLANDIYGFVNWRRMQKRQEKG